MHLERVTFEIQADNRADVLLRVVMLFHRLNVEVQALYMVRRRSSKTMRVTVTIEADQNGVLRLEANLYKIVQVRSVNTARRMAAD
jgi:acetolactate synthase small subunit